MLNRKDIERVLEESGFDGLMVEKIYRIGWVKPNQIAANIRCFDPEWPDEAEIDRTGTFYIEMDSEGNPKWGDFGGCGIDDWTEIDPRPKGDDHLYQAPSQRRK